MSVVTSVNRLFRLADLLRTVDPDDFYMGAWIRERTRGQKKAECGTVCCVGGWATAIHPKLELGPNNIVYKPNPTNRKGQLYGCDAFAKAFDLDFDDALDLVDADASHQTPKKAAIAVEKAAAALAKANDLVIVME